MLIGEPKLFAIECEITSRHRQFIYGRLKIWLGGQSLGRYSEEVLTLASTTGMLQDSLKSLRKNQDVATEKMTKDELLQKVWDAVYGDGGFDSELRYKYSPYVWFESCEGFETTRSLKIDLPDGQRIIWQNTEDSHVNEILLPKGCYESIVKSFLDWFEKETLIVSDAN